MKNKLYTLLIIVIVATMLLSACQTPFPASSGLDSTSDSDITPQGDVAPQAYKHDSEKYPLTVSLATKDDVDTVGISAGGVIVDGRKYAKDGTWINIVEGTEQPLYRCLGDVYLPNIGSMTDIPDGCPVIMYADGIEIVNNTDMTVSVQYYVPFTSAGPTIENLAAPTEPGMYWLLLTAESDEEPWTASDYVPVNGDTFITAYYYLFAVSVE